MSRWVEWKGKQLPGEEYRVRCTLQGPYNAAITGALKLKFRAEGAAKGLTMLGFDHAPPLWDAHTNRLGPWPFIARYRVQESEGISQAGIDPRVIFALAALVIAIAVSGALLSSKIEKRFEDMVNTVGDKTKDVLHEVLNPGLLVLAVVGIYLIARKGT